MTPADKEKLDREARLQQMKINSRLTALQASQTLMQLQGFADHPGHKIDAITLVANAQIVEQYILGDLEEETKKILDDINKPKIEVVKDMPKGLRP